MCCTPTLRWLIVSTLPLRLSPSSQPATGLSALAPAQRAGAQRLCALALLRPRAMSAFSPLLGVDRTSVGQLVPDFCAPKREFPEPLQHDRRVQEGARKINDFRFSEICVFLHSSRLARGAYASSRT